MSTNLLALAVFGIVLGLALLALLVGAMIEEIEWRIRSRRARKGRGQAVDLTGVRL